MSDVAEWHTQTAGTVVTHPSLERGKRKILSHEIAAKCTDAIASLDRVIECLERLARKPGFHLAEQHIRECQLVVLQLELLDPSIPPSAEAIGALYDRLGKLCEKLDPEIANQDRRPRRHQPLRIRAGQIGGSRQGR